MENATADLARWIPRLVAAWRGLCAGPGSRDHGNARRQHFSRGGRQPPALRGARGRDDAHRPPDRLLPEELQEAARGVQRLSTGLTRERALAGERYLEDPRLLGAYLVFYWPTSYLQARGVFSELSRGPGAVLDLGCGPGPLAFAALDAGASQVLGADRSSRALGAARALAAEAQAALTTRPWDPTRPGSLAQVAGGRTFDTITLGHVLNELFAGAGAPERRAALLEEAAALLRPGGSLVLIEPALRETSRQLLAVRDLLVTRGYAVRAPCLFRGPCPARLRETDWCHAERAIDPPPLVAEIARCAGLHKEAVKMSYLVLAPKGEAWATSPPGRVFRIVSEPLPSKGRLRYMACGPEGRMGISLQEKHVNERNHRFEELLRGDVVELTQLEPRGDGLRLSETSEVRLLARAGQAVPPGLQAPGSWLQEKP